MDMSGERRIAAPRARVWEALNDPAVLKACIPGCESLEKEGDAMRATAAVKIGPISAKFNGRVQLSDLDPPNSYRISGEGQGGVAGFAKGGADVQLADDGPGTLLTYNVKAQVGGKIAQLGARLIDATSKQMADLFFDRFSGMVAVPETAAAVAATDSTAAPATAAGATLVRPAGGTAPATVPGTATPPPAGEPMRSPVNAMSPNQPAMAQGVPVDAAPLSANPAGGRALAGSAAPIPVDTTAGPLSGTAADPSSPTRPFPNTVPPIPQGPAAISIFQLIPPTIFGLPIVAIIGILIYLPVFFLIFKGYIGL